MDQYWGFPPKAQILRNYKSGLGQLPLYPCPTTQPLYQSIHLKDYTMTHVHFFVGASGLVELHAVSQIQQTGIDVRSETFGSR